MGGVSASATQFASAPGDGVGYYCKGDCFDEQALLPMTFITLSSMADLGTLRFMTTTGIRFLCRLGDMFPLPSIDYGMRSTLKTNFGDMGRVMKHCGAGHSWLTSCLQLYIFACTSSSPLLDTKMRDWRFYILPFMGLKWVPSISISGILLGPLGALV
jgi:hypothetical protein